mmetsp:Transcript_25849/g.30466  ORF Transcript_25849/g.30466 Transcript_25849/m.30466 type:complete len:277 (+) Transcript_25849:883-1713(+)
MQVKFIPGKRNLEEKIRSKLKETKRLANNSNSDDDNTGKTADLTPWEKYQLKRKEKRKEHKKATRESKNRLKRGEHFTRDDMYENDAGDSSSKSKRKTKEAGNQNEDEIEESTRTPSSKEELDLLLAGDNDEEDARDFHMRSIRRIEKNKDKKLRGSRKRKEDKLASNTSGVGFEIDTADERFSALLGGTDARYGIDRTDPQYKETPAMQQILAEQTKRRRAKKQRVTKMSHNAADDVGAASMVGEDRSSTTLGVGAKELSLLVKSLKTNVAKNQK